jgi:hypothetical protein
MAHADLADARRHHAALKSIIERHPGDAADLRALRVAVELCRRAAEAVDDPYCHEKIRVAAEYAAELLSRGEHARWRRRSLSGVDYLKRQALAALELFESRLFVLNPRRY